MKTGKDKKKVTQEKVSQYLTMLNDTMNFQPKKQATEKEKNNFNFKNKLK